MNRVIILRTSPEVYQRNTHLFFCSLNLQMNLRKGRLVFVGSFCLCSIVLAFKFCVLQILLHVKTIKSFSRLVPNDKSETVVQWWCEESS